MYLSSGPGSELYIGGINPQKYRGEITYLPCRSKHHWIVEGSVRANGKESYRGGMAINSGTTLIFGPKKSVEEWWGNVFGSAPCPEEKCGGSGYFTFPCNFDASLSFKFNDREFLFAKDDLILRKLEKNKLICVGAIRAIDHDIWILGARFMKSVYTIFDADMSRVGFATPA
ncbi:aspartic protease [Rhizoctonia solani AG-3 Rhs1AP]|uniref:Aspartic protease n=2 Tax=Rhizoctonia solani AG-3 TaxID=1086053 RepID=X8IZE0_9AGAM|nr:aspartic protease [Rhizoctonia solani AG-3 Rhs1AP]